SSAKIEKARRTGTYRSAVSFTPFLVSRYVRLATTESAARSAVTAAIAVARSASDANGATRYSICRSGLLSPERRVTSDGLIHPATSGVLTDAAMPTTVRLRGGPAWASVGFWSGTGAVPG